MSRRVRNAKRTYPSGRSGKVIYWTIGYSFIRAMAKVDPVRRAEIGREKRARTRAQLIAAANALFARQSVESVTVDDVVSEAGVAKGTFYVHFENLRELIAAVADELVRSFDEMLQPGRLSLPRRAGAPYRFPLRPLHR